MKRFALALLFCASLLAALSAFLFPTIHAAENPILALLNLPAPPPPNPQVAHETSSERPPDFFSKSKPPPDDAPIDVLMEYWQAQSDGSSDLGYKIFPSEKVLDRLMDEIAKDPKKLGDLMNIFPRSDASSKFVRDTYGKMSGGDEGDRDRRSTVRRWMKYNTPYYSSELARDAGRVADVDDYVTNHRELIALARVDWNVAEPIVNRLYNNPGQKASRAAALWALYVHAMDSSSVSDVDKYRDELKEIVADKTLAPGVRDLALDALSLEKEWSGRDEWYVSMMEDETLTDLGRFTGLTTLPGSSPEGKYIDRMIGLLDSDNISVRSAAAQNLLDKIDWNREAIVKALVRWLENPKWLKETGRGGRVALVRALTQVKLPDAVPGLIAALDEKQYDSPIPRYRNSNAMANAANTAANLAMSSIVQLGSANSAGMAVNAAVNAVAMAAGNSYQLRHTAVEALAFQKDPRAVNPLKRILNEGLNSYENVMYVGAIYDCGGFTIAEQVAGVEKLAKASEEGTQADSLRSGRPIQGRMPSYEGLVATATSNYDVEGNPITDTSRLLGALLITRSDVEDGLAHAVIDRIAATEKSDPLLSMMLRKIVMRWQGTAVNAMLLRDLRSNKADVDAIVRLLAERKEIREKQPDDISDLRTGSQTAIGISSCLLEDGNDQLAILDGAVDETKTALLACARLIRSPLPPQKVAANLQSKDKLLALAAERYLEAEDSPEARQIVLSLHPNEAKILGASTAFFVDGDSGSATEYLRELFASVDTFHGSLSAYESTIERDPESFETEKRLQAEVKKDPDLLGIYNWRKNFIRIYKDRAVLTWENDPARYQERVLTNEEFDGFKGLLAHYKADELPPFLACASEDCDTAQLLMLGKNGGRRVFVVANPMPAIFADLDRIFQEMKQPPSIVKYWAAKDIPGLEVLFADEQREAMALWKNGGDFRLLTTDKAQQAAIEQEIEEFSAKLSEDDDDTIVPEYGEDHRIVKERERRSYESFVWNDFSSGHLGATLAQPEQVEYLPVKDSLKVPRRSGNWKARAGSVEVRWTDEGLYKVVAGKLTKIATGMFDNPVITPNGRWVVATSYGSDIGPHLVRVNLLTNRQFTVQSEEFPLYRAIAYVPSLNRILVGRFERESEEYDEGDEPAPVESGIGYSFLDPETGALIPARGEIRPLIQQSYRALQPTSNAFDFWVAIPSESETVIGVYNSRVFTVRPVLKLPKITFDSMNMWVDEAASKVYFIYEGHLLGVPIRIK